MHHQIEIDETDYQYLEHAAHLRGVTVERVLKQLIAGQRRTEPQPAQSVITEQRRSPTRNRWAAMSARIRQQPPLRGAGEYVQQCGEEFREEFTFSHDEDDAQ